MRDRRARIDFARPVPRLLGAAALCLALIPPVAQARKIAPPGNSGVEQYVEVVPGAEGNVPVNGKGHRGHTLKPSERKRLEESGNEGSALADFAEATGAPAKRSSRRGSGAGSNGHGGKRNEGGGSSDGARRGAAGSLTAGAAKAAALASQTTSGGGLGIGLPIALGAIALAGLLAFLLRRRSS